MKPSTLRPAILDPKDQEPQAESCRPGPRGPDVNKAPELVEVRHIVRYVSGPWGRELLQSDDDDDDDEDDDDEDELMVTKGPCG